ncbi:hypothetical protein LUZ60_001144 [Juncus effusus]|nr:hypothetical protein LUZ60_001144 [Juncus effusus]
MYISVPLLLYMGERILRTFRSKSYSAKILKVALLPGNVLTLTMAKPQGFHYRSGQYVFLQCAAISPFEWHPFSITSAPNDDALSVHIKAAGDWTSELMHIFVDKYISVLTAMSESPSSFESKSLPKLLVDGPYGASAQDFQSYDVLLLVGLGIGATPFVSILRDLLNNLKSSEDQLVEQDGKNSFKKYKTTNAYFYWVTRDPNSFEWFKGVMNEVADMDKKGVIAMHNYLTSVYEERDARSTLLALLQALHHAKHGVDIVSGARVRMNI